MCRSSSVALRISSAYPPLESLHYSSRGKCVRLEATIDCNNHSELRMPASPPKHATRVQTVCTLASFILWLTLSPNPRSIFSSPPRREAALETSGQGNRTFHRIHTAVSAQEHLCDHSEFRQNALAEDRRDTISLLRSIYLDANRTLCIQVKASKPRLCRLEHVRIDLSRSGQ